MRDAARRLVRVAAVGLLLGGGGVAALVLAGRSVQAASSTAFALGALVFGFGLTAWAGTLLLGNSFETLHGHLEAGGDWSAGDTRQAMSVLVAFGGAAMVGAVVATVVLDALVA